MLLSHLLLALAVVFVWGTNFVVIKLGLGELPPFLFATLRFLFSAFPFVFFTIGMAASPWWLGEALPGWKLSAAALVIAGLALNVIVSRRMVERGNPGAVARQPR